MVTAIVRSPGTICLNWPVDYPTGSDYIERFGNPVNALVLTQDSGHAYLRSLGQNGRVGVTGKHENCGLRVSLADHPGGVKAIWGIREAKI